MFAWLAQPKLKGELVDVREGGPDWRRKGRWYVLVICNVVSPHFNASCHGILKYGSRAGFSELWFASLIFLTWFSPVCWIHPQADTKIVSRHALARKSFA